MISDRIAGPSLIVVTVMAQVGNHFGGRTHVMRMLGDEIEIGLQMVDGQCPR